MYSISVIIPVLNEADLINRCIDHVKTVGNGHNSEIIVVDGDENGTTIKKLNSLSVKKLISSKGRAVQMNLGASKASGDVLLFLHADTSLPENAFEEVFNTLKSGEFRGGAFELSIDNPKFAFRLIELFAALRYRNTGIPFGDQAIFIERDYFNYMGGYNEIPLMEDVDLMRRIKKEGGKINIIPLKAISSARNWERDGIFYTTLRNWILQIMFSLGVSPKRLVKFYYPEDRQ